MEESEKKASQVNSTPAHRTEVIICSLKPRTGFGSLSLGGGGEPGCFQLKLDFCSLIPEAQA